LVHAVAVVKQAKSTVHCHLFAAPEFPPFIFFAAERETLLMAGVSASKVLILFFMVNSFWRLNISKFSTISSLRQNMLFFSAILKRPPFGAAS
jgi:hypothetical protein